MSQSNSNEYYTIQDPMLPAIIQDLPQVMTTIGNYNNRMKELRLSLQPTISAIPKSISEEDIKSLPEEYDVSNGISFLQLRTQLLLQYNMNVLQYMTLRAEGRVIEGHPCIKRLVHLRVIMEKMKPIMNQLQHQIEQTLRTTASDPSENLPQQSKLTQAEQFTAITPTSREQHYEQKRLEAAERKELLKQQQAEHSKELDTEFNRLNKRSKFQSLDELQEQSMNNLGLAGDDMASQYHLREKRIAELAELKRNTREKASYTTLVRQLREDLSERPLEQSSTGLSLHKLRTKEQRERLEFEEENYMRLQDNKQERKKQRRAERLQGMDDVDEIADYRALYTNNDRLAEKSAREKALRDFEAAEAQERLMDSIGENVKRQHEKTQGVKRKNAPRSR